MGKTTAKLALLAGLLLPTLACAAGLGKLTVLSALGQTLRAEIEIVSLQPNEGESLSARLASPEAFSQANVERPGVLMGVRFAVEPRPNGRYVLVLSSAEPINEPFLDMLVELGWANGRLVREYTFLLDPPEYKGPPVATPIVPAPVPQVVQPIPVPVPQAPEARMPPPVEEKPLAPAQAQRPAAPAPALERPRPPAPVQERARAPAPAPGKPRAPAAPKRPLTYEVKRGDTLARIAEENRPAGATLQQMLAALYRRNESEFDAGNMNRMRAGKILTLPEPAEVASIPQEEARSLVAAQSVEYAEYRRQLAAAVASAQPRAEGGRQVSGKIGAPPEEKPAPSREPAKDQLRLSKPDDVKGSTPARAAALADELSSRDKALKEANERIAQLEKNVQDLQKLLALKSEAGARMQQDAKPPETAKPAAKAPEPAKAEAPPPPSEPAAPAPKAPPAAAAKAPAKAVTPPPAPAEPSFVDELLDNPIALGGAGAIVVLLAGYGAYAWRKKRKAQVESSPFGASAPGEAPFGVSGGQQVDTGSVSLQSDFSQGGVAKIDTEEIDPIAEADVYMAYGRDAQAEEILKEALAKDSSRHAIRAKLLEIYASRKDQKAFEATARELHAATGGQGPEWEKAVSLGRSVDPLNPLFGAMAAAAVAGALHEAPAAAERIGEPAPSDDQGKGPAAMLDFDLDLSTAPTPSAPVPDIRLDDTVTAPEATPASLDFDLGLGEKAAATPAAEALEVPMPESRAPAETPAMLDFDLALGGGAASAAAPKGETAGDKTLVFDVPVQEAKLPEELPASLDMGLALGERSVEPGKTESATGGTLSFDAVPVEARVPEAAAPGAGSGISIDFDLGPDEPAVLKPTTVADSVAPVAPVPTINFALPGEPAPPGERAAGEKPAEIDLSAFSLDLGAPPAVESGPGEVEPDSHWQEVATKLDLAKAYEEMGDKEGARELLNEVIKEGDAAQKQQAMTMLESLG